MRRLISLVLAAVLAMLVAGSAEAATVDISIVSTTVGFDPKTATGAFGDTFRWTNDDALNHTTTQDSPLALWDSGTMGAGDSFSKAVDFAGAYPYHCSIHTSMTGTVKVPVQVMPPSGSVGTAFRVTVASVAAPSGFVYDIQRKTGSGSWTAWKTGITSKSVTFRPKASGTWSFRSRLRETDGGKSGWSPPRSISVTSGY
jgi:plastocyanin